MVANTSAGISNLSRMNRRRRIVLAQHDVGVTEFADMAIQAGSGLRAAKKFGFTVKAVQITGNGVVALGFLYELQVAVTDGADLCQLSNRACRLETTAEMTNIVGHINGELSLMTGLTAMNILAAYGDARVLQRPDLVIILAALLPSTYLHCLKLTLKLILEAA